MDGVRRLTCQKDASGKTICAPSNCPWHTTWAQFCGDDRIRFEYTIDVDQHQLGGYCKVTFHTNPRDELRGRYCLVPPVPDEVDTARSGEIVFWRPRPGEHLEDCTASPR